MDHPAGSVLADPLSSPFQPARFTSTAGLHLREQVRITGGPFCGLSGWLCEIGEASCLTQLSALGDGVYARVSPDMVTPAG
jgi:hypothetical protein